MTAFFGPMLPVLFLYGFLGLIILYVTIRVRIAYFLRLDLNVHQDVIFNLLVTLEYSPLIYMGISAWLYSNQQMFENEVLANTSHS